MSRALELWFTGRLAERFNPSQKRDRFGKWTSQLDGGTVKELLDELDTKAAQRRERRRFEQDQRFYAGARADREEDAAWHRAFAAKYGLKQAADGYYRIAGGPFERQNRNIPRLADGTRVPAAQLAGYERVGEHPAGGALWRKPGSAPGHGFVNDEMQSSSYIPAGAERDAREREMGEDAGPDRTTKLHRIRSRWMFDQPQPGRLVAREPAAQRQARDDYNDSIFLRANSIASISGEPQLRALVEEVGDDIDAGGPAGDRAAERLRDALMEHDPDLDLPDPPGGPA